MVQTAKPKVKPWNMWCYPRNNMTWVGFINIPTPKQCKDCVKAEKCIKK